METSIVSDPYEANYAITITEIGIKRIVAILYFNVPEGNPVSSIFNVLSFYEEYCQPNFRLDINQVRNGRRISKNF